MERRGFLARLAAGVGALALPSLARADEAAPELPVPELRLDRDPVIDVKVTPNVALGGWEVEVWGWSPEAFYPEVTLLHDGLGDRPAFGDPPQAMTARALPGRLQLVAPAGRMERTLRFGFRRADGSWFYDEVVVGTHAALLDAAGIAWRPEGGWYP